MKSKLMKMLNEWKLDCENVEKKFGERLPQHDLINDVLAYQGDKAFMRKLAFFLKEEIIRDIGMMPDKSVKIMDMYSTSTFGFSLREEWHTGYWMLVEEVER